ncbi:assimilatory sulfite reductase (NADPH) flavoprotein subunit [[Mannheimia] succiniciproducens]|uniref:Sulfite reductase [NADPH] flavoprotein alpha-component n=1 Tax=Mannheimia succiniciproducens (strain KCTC 0769BP / MBEL55E) TaxID=221988 RepID=CYSJ_MANSM|nr:assimilatory sulfite reductase (NADPH) flavoprotein subunit [[Mannheimia] succiniciproducens]Q65T53.1 RecName: Full=Sulfite reductase [NADPH] flavoprotein alpha-component; Short=SiR-FP [[Mannheimia] succiniciproducens MBEL55E]AAU37857.1 CysJ protein [[Mannheimia] succiniciproducens MBEL55E]
MSNTTNPLPPETEQLLAKLNPIQLAWLSGYAWAKAQGEDAGTNVTNKNAASTLVTEDKPLNVTVLSASQTGNANGVANQLAERLKAEGVNVTRKALKEYKAKTIGDEQFVLLVTSTQGEGEAPEEGVPLYKLLHGKKAPNLANLEFAVLGLGDTSYPNFCQAGKDFDKRFEELGAKRLLARADADLDFKSTADKWIQDVVEAVKAKSAVSASVVASVVSASSAQSAVNYSKENPYTAKLITNQKITARDSAKDVRHFEFDLSGSGLQYKAGDALGVWAENDPDLINEVLGLLKIQPDESVQLNGKSLDIHGALLSRLELTQNTPAFVKGYAQLANNKKLTALVSSDKKLADYVNDTPIVDVLHDFPAKISAQQFADLLRPLTPRLYSISSSPEEVGEEVHLSVGVVRFEHEGRARTGVASGFLADRVEEDGEVKIFVEPNDNFRLPQDKSKPIIMIGSGTGIAPFRAFLQQRQAEEAEGKNWLIFGNQHFATDFLYQAEWQQFVKDGYLHKYDFAWSRDQAEKIYVQDKIREKSTALWQWLQEGAHVYVCGDASKMAKDVENALLEVIAREGKLTPEDAEEYLNDLREDKRYQRDVY